ncbi:MULTISPECIES: VOC family protein [unclassified Haladaptatus]|uniref:VOC family protein n=1 Tax=unclassified Haladaptatus TaxID=2622732 RepID=UPI0023E7765D|nr:MULTISPECIES: VOC family protein [unclassified Haladaptatus]
MFSSLRWLALEVKYLGPAVSFYREHLALPVRREGENEVALGAGETDLILRAPSTVPRGGLHTHYAFSTPAAEYDDWWNTLGETFELEEVQFGAAKSLYFYDGEGNCVEIGQSDDEGAGITGIFEIVLEVEDLERAVSFYTDLGLQVRDRGDQRRRVRLDAGPFDIELWEPQLGLADARGGVHVDIGVTASNPAEKVAQVADQALAVRERDGEFVVKDPDGHYLTIG